MDLMKPKLVWIERRCYRFFEKDASSEKDHASAPHAEDANPQEFDDLHEDTCPIDIDIIPVERGRYENSFNVPNALFKFIVGAGGAHKKKLENDTGTNIRIPRFGQNGDIVITGSSQTAIISARHRIDLLVESKQKIRHTHFLSIPMIDRTIALNYEKLKNTILNENAKDSCGIRDGIFQKPEKMHITLGMLTLVDDDRVKMAIRALDECNEKIIKPLIEKTGPIIIKAQGLECMNSNLSKVSVVYGKVSSDENSLQELAEKTQEFFIQKGLMKKEHDKVNLHLTLMNASFMVDRKAATRQRYEKFDATNILKSHKDYFFGEIALSTIHLSKLGPPKAEDGYYAITSKINLTE